MRWIICLCLCLNIFRPAFAEPPQLSHLLSTRWAINTGDIETQLLDMAWRPELHWRFEDGGRLTAMARLRYQPEKGMRPTDMELGGYSTISSPALIGDNGELELREFYYQRYAGDWFVTLGKQQVVWGKADGLKVLDVINPQSFREFILEDFDQSRIPLWSVNAERSLDDWNLQLLWVADLTYHAQAKPGSTYAFSSPRLVPQAPPGVLTLLEDPERPTNPLGDSDIGLRMTGFVGGWDLSLNYLYQYYNQAALHQQMVPGPVPVVVVTPRYHRTHVAGGTFSRAFGDWVARGELGYFSDRFFLITGLTDSDGVARSSELIYVIGLDWSGIDNTFISVQFFQSWLADFEAVFTRPELDTNITLMARREYWNDTLAAEVIWISNSNDGDGLVRPKINYHIKDGVEIWGGLDIFYGSDLGLFGQFGNNNRLLLGIEMGF